MTIAQETDDSILVAIWKQEFFKPFFYHCIRNTPVTLQVLPPVVVCFGQNAPVPTTV